MSTVEPRKVRIGNKIFINVTDQTSAGRIYSMSEAIAKGERNEEVACSD